MFIQINKLISIMEGFSKQKVFYDTSTGTFLQSDDLKMDPRYVSVTKFDDIKIINMYIDQLSDKKLRRTMNGILSDDQLIAKFHRLINEKGIYNDFIHFSQEVKQEAAKEWCNKNNLKYTLKQYKPQQQ